MSKSDGMVFVAVLICFALWLVVFTAHHKTETKCGLKLAKFQGEYCQKRDHRGNIYYVSHNGQTVVTIP